LDNSSETNDKIAEESELKEKDNKKLESKQNQKEDISNNKITKDAKPIEKDKKIDTTNINTAPKKPESKLKEKQDKDDFRYIVRIANTDIDGEKTIERGLTSIKGIGMHMSTLVIDSSGLDRNLKMGNLERSWTEQTGTFGSQNHPRTNLSSWDRGWGLRAFS